MSEQIQRVTILGTGLIGASIGLALRAQGFSGTISGWDRTPAEAEIARKRGAVDVLTNDPLASAKQSDCIVLATPVFGILEWMNRLAPALRAGQLVTDVGSTKLTICERAGHAFSGSNAATFLPGHPMAGKEVHGALHADGSLFRGAVWLFTKSESESEGKMLGLQRAEEWKTWVRRFGSRILHLDPRRHDEVCAWASHLPQMVGTALAALLEDMFPEVKTSAETAASGDAGDLRAIGGRAMHEMTRLGASPFSMWRDIAQTNQEPIAAALLALEQRLALIRENLKQPELREQFEHANRFRERF